MGFYCHFLSQYHLILCSYTKKIQSATKEELFNYRLIGGGIGVHFEQIDEDISLSGIIYYKLKPLV